ncbi:MAG TPA: DEAD/DEAH box helicase family protein, partial [Candidatus Saccharimonadales bacterium]|nr:DEAD/DEAH box helicase family protein [Candidatus Saccharimonadales bacterium]
MFYYLVWVRSSRYHGSEPLTYSSDQKLVAGSIVDVELQTEQVLGFVSGSTTRPRFKIKPISRIYDLPPLPPHLLRLAKWLQEYYPAPLGIVSQQLLPANLAEKQLRLASPSKLPKPDLSTLPLLTAEQKAALAAMVERNTYLLHGITGSGKTRIYIELAARALAEGQSAIILTPEISLTTQLADSFRQVFGNRVLVMHSQQAPSERQAAWL